MLTIPCICEKVVSNAPQIGEFVICHCGYRWNWNLMGWQLYIGVNKPMNDIPSGEVFSGNPKAPCPALPFSSGATGRGLYVKVLDGVMSLSGSWWPHCGAFVVENYFRVGKLGEIVESYQHKRKSLEGE